MIDDPKAVILAGDEIHHTLPNGLLEVFDVIDPAFHKGHGPFTPHYQVKIARKGTRQASQAVNNHYNASGPNARINIASYDASTNTATTENVFQDIRSIVAKNASDDDVRDRLLSLVERMESEKNKPGFAKVYAEFTAFMSNHITILTALAPMLPALSQFIPG